VYSLKVAGDVLWACIAPSDEPVGSPGWLVKMDRHSGRMLGHLELLEALTGHAVDLSSTGEPMATEGNELLWFRTTH
jgi:hypothetical protein